MQKYSKYSHLRYSSGSRSNVANLHSITSRNSDFNRYAKTIPACVTIYFVPTSGSLKLQLVVPQHLQLVSKGYMRVRGHDISVKLVRPDRPACLSIITKHYGIGQWFSTVLPSRTPADPPSFSSIIVQPSSLLCKYYLLAIVINSNKMTCK